jgi:isopentenyl diphosphate isomerase/L-lactate dehydrogenase-like FMN-dependent dehydrogenase
VAPEFATNEEIVRQARRRLNQEAWDYLTGASESETSMRRNRAGFDRLAFLPRTLVDVSNVDTSTTLMGHKLNAPVILAPMGTLQTLDREGGAASTKAAAEFGTLHVVSSVTQPSLEDISAATDAPKIFQLYIRGGWAWVEEMLGRINAAGYKGLCITVDTAVQSRRERVMMNRLARGGGSDRNPLYPATVTWELLGKIKETSGLPLMVKGIATAADASLAVEHGVDVVWVSNHGGRQLDHNRGTMDMLPEIVGVVGGRAEVIMDGGVQRGSDMAKALALGAKAVAIGKLQGWGLGADGAAGVQRVLEILAEELFVAMSLLGVTSVDQLTPDYVCPADIMTTPHEMSSWVNMPGDRLL